MTMKKAQQVVSSSSPSSFSPSSLSPSPASPSSLLSSPASPHGALRLGHVAVVVPSLSAALVRWQEVLQRSPSPCQTLEEHGVRLVFFDLDNTRLELLEPFGERSPLASFLAKHPRGGIHHICFETQNIETLHARLKQQNLPFANDARIARGAHDNPVFFLHPQALDGALVEFEGIGQDPTPDSAQA